MIPQPPTPRPSNSPIRASQSLLTGDAMADEAVDWDAFDEFINSDFGFDSSTEGHDMHGVGTGEEEDARGTISYKEEWLSDGMPGLPRTLSQQQFDQQGSYHSFCLPPRLHGNSSTRAVITEDVTHDFYPFNREIGAGEIDTQTTANIHEPNVPRSGLITIPPPVLSDLDAIDSVLSTSACIAGTDPSEALHIKPCTCILCVGIGEVSDGMDEKRVDNVWQKQFQCRYHGCLKKVNRFRIVKHERSHFCLQDQYQCAEEHCKLTTKRWTDLKRHTASKHCTRPEKKFPCPVLWCKHSGSNGFARKDKLNSHIKTVHHGMTMPGKANQAIKPKVDGGA